MKLDTSYVFQRGARSQGLALLGLLGAPFLIGASAASEKVVGSPLAAIAMLASIALMIGSGVILAVWNRTKRGEVIVDDTSVSFAGSRLARAEIASAYYAPSVGSTASVRLLGKGGRELAWIGVPDHAAADVLLAKLGLEAEKTTARFQALAKFRSSSGMGMLGALGVAVLFMVLAAAVATPALVVPSVLVMIAGSAYFLPAKIHVGADGLLYKTRLAPRFFAWADVESVRPCTRGLALTLRGGEVFEIPTTQRARMYYQYERVAQAALYSRAWDSLQAFRRGAVPEITTRVERRGSTKDEWLARLFDREGSFRNAPLRNDDLWKVVESPAASHTARAGAAAVLARESSDEDRVRLRVAAETCAEPRLRVVLDKAGGGAADEELLAALDEVEDERAAEA